MNDKTCFQICADMLCDNGFGDSGLINHKLVTELMLVNDLCIKAGGRLRSRQVIATIIVRFMIENPNEKLYGD